jgi:hypothetical protein
MVMRAWRERSPLDELYREKHLLHQHLRRFTFLFDGATLRPTSFKFGSINLVVATLEPSILGVSRAVAATRATLPLVAQARMPAVE